jgi:UDP-N-acetylglucosamine 2-epimerase
VERLLKDKKAYERMARVRNPFGDGHAAKRIVPEDMMAMLPMFNALKKSHR